jgi:hypothetical protein
MGIRYQYRRPERSDIRVAIIKLAVYATLGITTIVLANTVGENSDTFQYLFIGLIGHSAIMVYDAVTVVLGGQVRLGPPIFLDYLIAIQDPKPHFGFLLDLICLGLVGFGVFHALSG